MQYLAKVGTADLSEFIRKPAYWSIFLSADNKDQTESRKEFIIGSRQNSWESQRNKLGCHSWENDPGPPRDNSSSGPLPLLTAHSSASLMPEATF